MELRHRVAFVCPRLASSFTRAFWYALQDEAARLGVQLTAVVGGNLGSGPGVRVYDLIDRVNFDGVILSSGALGYRVGIEALAAFAHDLDGLPTVSLGIAVPGMCSVSMDQEEAVATVVRHLHDHHGLRRFVWVAGPPGQVEAEARLRAFRATVADLGIPADDVTELPGNFTRSSGVAAVRSLNREGPWPVALVCANDESALGALEECRARGLAVPAQVSVTGFDDLEVSALWEPSLTSVAQPLIRQARVALAKLVDLLEGRPADCDVSVGQFRYRESCGCRPTPVPEAPATKAELLAQVLATQGNATVTWQTFAQEWTSDLLTAFEHLLDTGNTTVLKAVWSRYFARRLEAEERGVPFRGLFAGLEALYGSQPRFEAAYRDNLYLAGTSEARRGTLADQASKRSSQRLHLAEFDLGRIQDRPGLEAFPFGTLEDLGLAGVAVLRFGDPPRPVYVRTRTSGDRPTAEWSAARYPELLPDDLAAASPPTHRLVIALTAEDTYLGYGVFWADGPDISPAELVAQHLAAALRRIELLETLQRQRRDLEASLEETRRMQEQLVETEKVASLGRLVAGVAHEVNTPLGTGITGSSFLVEKFAELKGQLAAGQLARSALDKFLSQGTEVLDGVLRNLMKAGELIQAFKGLGLDHGQGEWKPVVLPNLFGDLTLLYRSELAQRGIELQTELPPEGGLVYTQPSALVQVVSELIENAMEHAFPRNLGIDPQVLLQVAVEDEFLKVAVTDNGCGLTVEERRHIFDPLYTTKRAQGHAGLGLHLAYQLVHRTLGGRMTVASDPGHGSCFLCRIPLKTP